MTLLASVGRLDGFCTSCKREVIISEQTLACPNCGRQVDPLSLPAVPKAERVEPVRAVVPAKAIEPAPQQPQTVSLPSIKEAGAWSRATDTLLEALEREEAAAEAALEAARKRAREARRAASALRQVRSLVLADGSADVPSSSTLGLCRTCDSRKRHGRAVS